MAPMERLKNSMPASLKSEVLVRAKTEEPEIQRQRQELVRSKSPAELSQISSFSDIPVLSSISNLIPKRG